ncbi:MAG: c-type cytochrome biogenesis protein CcmI [Hyphomicrobiaceae bacterium]|nr:c-type cytochrome biogenesis protein CcmI [Hyphomicrobiaceae bacterium]
MLLWIAFALLTAGVVVVLTRPLVTGGSAALSARDADMAVYRDQLAEIDADLERGLIEASEAEAARNELARRLIRRADAPAGAAESAIAVTKTETGKAAGNPALYLAAAIPVIAIAIYLVTGHPELPGQPLAARLAASPERATMDELVGRVEAQLRQHPEDGRGWDVIAPIYLAMNRFPEAANAFSQSLRLNGESPKRIAGFAEALVLADNGVVGEPARKAFARLLELEPGRPEARFWLALAKEQDGKTDEAAADYRALLSEAPEGAPWRQLVGDRLAAVTGGSPLHPAGPVRQAAPASATPEAGKPLPSASPGPSSSDIAAAQGMSQAERTAMIEGMVGRLAQRLEQNPADFDGWLRLVRAYVVLGRKGDAGEALGKARRSFASEPGRLADLDALARELGIGT